MRGDALVIRGDARRLPLPDKSVDLVVTSPPFWNLRDYGVPGQIGTERNLAEFLDELWASTAECVRVMKPTASLFVELGDSYSDKSLNLAPQRYAIGCTDHLGLYLRAEIIWDRPNGLPDSAIDRVGSSHSRWWHLTKQPDYYSDTNEIREPYSPEASQRRALYGQNPGRDGLAGLRATGAAKHGSNGVTVMGVGGGAENPLGKLPGSVWTVPSEPLRLPDWLEADHYAAFPSEWPRRFILGWSPPGGVILDPFAGTFTTVMVARALDRVGIGVDLNPSYCRVGKWRVWHSGTAGKSVGRTWRERQESLL